MTVATLATIDEEAFIGAARNATMKVMREAARRWLAAIADRVPEDSGFLLGAFLPLAELLNVNLHKKTSTRPALNPFFNLKRQIGAANLETRLFKLRLELERKRKFLGQTKIDKNAGLARQGRHSSDQTTEANLGSGQSFDKQEFLERKIAERIQYYKDKKLKSLRSKAKTRFKTLKPIIADLEAKLRKIRANRIDHKNQKVPIIDKHGNVKYNTTKVPIPYTQKERLDAIRKKIKLPDRFETVRERALQNKYRKFYYPRKGQKGPLKTPTSGKRYSTAPADIFELSSPPTNEIKGTAFSEFNSEELNITVPNLTGTRAPNRKGAIIQFRFDVNINYYRLNDLYKSWNRNGKLISPRGVPWHSQDAAFIVFMQYLRANIAKAMPDFTDYLIKTRTSLRKNTITTDLLQRPKNVKFTTGSDTGFNNG